jgi:2-polyprenyl-3-methyl-5-hydroxy-6-metoxy-1,4-benzoquinol methylase
VGLYIGVQPVFGLHLPLCLLICLPLRLDALIAYAAANISNPLLAGLIVFSEVQIGSLILDARLLPLTVAQVKQTHWGHLALQTAVGAQLLGVTLAAFGWVVATRLAHLALTRSARGQSVEPRGGLSAAVARTVARYTGAAAGDRYYVACKLRWDPITRVIANLPLEWGSLLDIGCGRGQLGLLLVELGRVRSLQGLDWDSRKIEVARHAAGPDAHFEVANLASNSLANCETALLVDVLHYLDPSAQTELLKQVHERLVAGGTLVLRDIDARPSWRSRITRCLEVTGTRLKVNRGRRLYFQPGEYLQNQLQQVGFQVTGTLAMPGFSLDNLLITARKP